jgi:hypothetical protein
VTRKPEQFAGGAPPGDGSNGGVSAVRVETPSRAENSGLPLLSLTPALLFGCVEALCGLNIAALTPDNCASGGQL